MAYSQNLIERLAKEVLTLRKNNIEKKELQLNRKLEYKEKDEIMKQSFSFVLKQNRVHEHDWHAIKSAIGQQMNLWKKDAKNQQLLQEIRLQIMVEDAAALEIAELVHSGEIELD